MTHQFKARVTQKMGNILLAASKKIVEANHFMACLNEPVAEVGA
jgi:hypothetical protein